MRPQLAGLAWFVIAALAMPARAGEAPGTIKDGEHYFQLVVPGDWTPVAAPDDMILVYQSPQGAAHLSIGRVPIGRGSSDERETLVADILRGIESATPGFRLRKKRLREIGSIPVLDIHYRRRATSGHSQVSSRLLLYRRHAIILSIGQDQGASSATRRAASAILDSFVPFVP